MDCHGGSSSAPGAGRNIILVGNHNVGKSLIFGWLTGTYATVANYPGTTVEIMRGSARANPDCGVIDTPGINSLQPISDDERVTRDVVIGEEAQAVVQVADAKNLRRALLITAQLSDAAVPLVLTLNMMDEARARGIAVDAPALSQRIGAPVVATTATTHEGLDALRTAIEAPASVRALVRYDDAIEAGLAAIESELRGRHPQGELARVNLRALAVMFLAGDASMDEWLRAHAGPEALARLAG